MRGICFSLLLVLTAATAWATPIRTSSFTSGTAGETAYPASTTDLINGIAPVMTNYTNSGGSANGLSDGSVGSPDVLTASTWDNDGVFTAVFTLDTSVNTNGYKITEIDTITGWTDNRTSQQYTLAYSTVDAPGTFVPLTGPDAGGTFQDLRGQGGLKIAVTDSTGTLATRVKAIQFNSQLATGQNSTVWREIDAFGTVAVPEPSGLALGLASLLGLTLFAIRRR